MTMQFEFGLGFRFAGETARGPADPMEALGPRPCRVLPVQFLGSAYRVTACAHGAQYHPNGCVWMRAMQPARNEQRMQGTLFQSPPWGLVSALDRGMTAFACGVLR